jgi:hypothetical protein
MKVGRKIYYDLATGTHLVDTGEMDNVWANPQTVDQDIATFTTLSERNRDTFDVIELPFGAYAQDFAECGGYKVNPTTKELEFAPKPITPDEPLVFGKPFSEQIKEQKQYTQQLNDDLMSLSDYVTTL